MNEPDTPDLSLEQARQLLREINLHHVAIIMDGNRRWAKDRHLPTLLGHQQGVEALKALVRHCGDIGLDALTVYAFSTENWKRTEEEVGYLMKLFLEALKAEFKALHKNNVRLKFIGDLSAFPEALLKQIHEAEGLMAGNTGLQFQVAANYGSRYELVQAAQKLAFAVQQGELQPEAITEEALAAHLYTAHLPELDLLIRTGGEFRISNYLLWQAAYAELYVTETLWPDFSPQVFNRALQEYARRERRFGR